MIDIRDHIRALDERGAMERRLAERTDITRYAEMLIDAQDAVTRGETPLVPAGITRALPTAADIAAVLVAHVEYEPSDGDEGLPMPGGVRFPTFMFSPVMQFALFSSTDKVVEGKRIPALPASQKDLETWLLASMGFIPSRRSSSSQDTKPADPARISGKREDEVRHREAEDIQRRREVEREFAARCNFSLAELASWLLALRASDPITYLLLMSREYRLALAHRPRLIDFEIKEFGERRHFKNFACRQILAPLTVAELQRAFAVTRSLHRHGGGTTGTVAVKATVHTTMPGTRTIGVKALRGQRMADQMEMETGVGQVIDQAPLHADAIRRILNLRGRRAADLDIDAVYRALEEGRHDWDNAKSSKTRVGAHELIASTIAPVVMKRPGLQRGQRLVNRPLDIYYGVEAVVIPSLAITELGLPISRAKGRKGCEVLASAMLTTVTGSRSLGGHSTETRHRRAVDALDHYLPPYPRLGSAGRFVATAWLERHHDEPLFAWLVTDRQIEAPTEELPDNRWLLALAIRLLKEEFPGVYQNRKAGPDDLKLFADLATAVTVMSSDPILLAMLLRAIAGAKATGNAGGPPDSNLPSRRGQVALGDAGLLMSRLEHRLRVVVKALGIA